MKLKPRHYQASGIRAVQARVSEGYRSPLIVAPTGAGKTVIACMLIEWLLSQGARILFLAHRTELITQCSAKLAEFGIEHGVIKAGMSRGSLRMPVQVASVQTFDARIENLPHHFTVIITDEAHHATAASYGRVRDACAAHCGEILHIGLTATPYRTDGEGLGEVFDCLILIPITDTATLIGEGFLVPTRIFAGEQRLDVEGLKQKAGDYDSGQLSRRMNRPRLVGHIVEEYLRHAADRITVCFAVDVAHSMAIAEAFQAAGVQAEHLDGTTPAVERRAILARLARGETRIVVNCGVLTEGFDCPPVSCVIAARPTKSRCLWRQCVGRGLRPWPEGWKVDCIILDHAGWKHEHGYVTDPDICTLRGAIAQERAAAQIECPSCGAQLVGRPPFCPECGIEFMRVPSEIEPDLGDRNSRLHEDDPQFNFTYRPPDEPPRAPFVAAAPSRHRIRR